MATNIQKLRDSYKLVAAKIQANEFDKSLVAMVK